MAVVVEEIAIAGLGLGGLVDMNDLEHHYWGQVAGLWEAIEAIESVHGVPEGLPGVRVEVWSLVAGGAAGAYDPGERLIRLAESEVVEFGASTLVHELGHHLLSYGGLFYSEIPDMRAAIRASRAWALLAVGDDPEYMADPHELFARAYGQWIAERSGSQVLLRQLERTMELSPAYQWGSDDFIGIGQALDAYFIEKGWRGVRW